MDTITLLLLRLRHRFGGHPGRPGDHPSHSGGHLGGRRDDRGDVPGWVLVVVMTAGLCAALYGIAKDQLSTMLATALDQVK